MKQKLPIGIDNFEKLRKDNFYYVDKTGLIRELLENWGEVNLFTRPRRFGKSLNMSMLQSFFSTEGDPAVFQGLEIMRETKLCEEYMGKFKYAHDGDLTSACLKALQQIEDTNYEEELRAEGIDRVLKYGIACYKKNCRVMVSALDQK